MSNLLSAISYKAPPYIITSYLSKYSIEYLVVIKDHPGKIFLTTNSPTINDTDDLLNISGSSLLLINKNIGKNFYTMDYTEIINNLQTKLVKPILKSTTLKSKELPKPATETKPVIEPPKPVTKPPTETKPETKPPTETKPVTKWPSRCNFKLTKRNDKDLSHQWLNDKFGGDNYTIYDVLGDGNCFFYSFIYGIKFNKSESERNNIQEIPQQIKDGLKKVLDKNNVNYSTIEAFIEQKAKEQPLTYKINLTDSRDNCIKYNYSLLALRYILYYSLKGDSDTNYEDRYSIVLMQLIGFSYADPKTGESIDLIDLDDVKKQFPTVDSLKNFFITSNYYADDWAIKKITNACNIQPLIFNETKKDYKNRERKERSGVSDWLVGCGPAVGFGPRISTNPDTILINWKSNNHYQLITYKDPNESNKELGMVKFNNLPKEIQDSCPQKNTSPSGGKKTTKKYIKKQKQSRNKKKLHKNNSKKYKKKRKTKSKK